MNLKIERAIDSDMGFCEQLSRSNMAAYRTSRGIEWDSDRFLKSWQEFENNLIVESGNRVGLLRLFQFDNVLEIRDLQILPNHMRLGIGTWAIQQTKQRALANDNAEIRLRVYPENPALQLYLREGFKPVTTVDDVIHMSLVFEAL